jgi:hypothetical protein
VTRGDGTGRVILVLLAATLLPGCGSSRTSVVSRQPLRHLPADYVPMTVGPTAAYRPTPTTAAVRAGRPVDGLRCSRSPGPRFGAHLEIFAHQHVVAIPTGIGITPPVKLNPAARVQRGRCYYPVMSTDPTGVLEIRSGARLTLGSLFAVWGQPLSHHGAASFTLPRGQAVVAYVGTRRWTGDPRAIPLRHQTRVVLELQSHVPPHRTYDFPPGL